MGPLFEVSLVLSSRNTRLSKFPFMDHPETGLASTTHFEIFPNTQQKKSTQKAHRQPCLNWRLLPLSYVLERIVSAIFVVRHLLSIDMWSEYEARHLLIPFRCLLRVYQALFQLFFRYSSRGIRLQRMVLNVKVATDCAFNSHSGIFSLSPEHTSTAQIFRAKTHVDSAKMSIQGSGDSDLIPRRYD